MFAAPLMARPDATRKRCAISIRRSRLTNFYQAYANRALVDRYMGDNNKAVQDYSRAIRA